MNPNQGFINADGLRGKKGTEKARIVPFVSQGQTHLIGDTFQCILPLLDLISTRNLCQRPKFVTKLACLCSHIFCPNLVKDGNNFELSFLCTFLYIHKLIHAPAGLCVPAETYDQYINFRRLITKTRTTTNAE